MFGFRVLKLVKIILLSSVVITSMQGYAVLAGDVIYPKPQYPSPILPPIMPSVKRQTQYQAQNQYQAQGQYQAQSQYQQQGQYQAQSQYQQQGQYQAQEQYQSQGQSQEQSQASFIASVDVSVTYNGYEVNNGTTTTLSSQSFVELRPYFAYRAQENGVEFGGSFYSSLSYELGGTATDYVLGRSEADFLVKKEGNFAFGATAGYDKKYFNSSSPDPASSGTYRSLDVSGFAEKMMGQFGLSLTGMYINDTYDGTLQNDDTTYSEEAKDNSIYGVGLRLNHHIDQSASIFVEANYTAKQFVITPTPNLNETAYGIRVGGTYNFDNQFAVEAAGSYGYHVVECGCTTHSYGADVKLIASLGGNVSGSVYAAGEYTTSTNVVLDSESRKIGADLSIGLGSSVELSAGAEYGVALSGPNEGEDISANANITYAVFDNLDLFAGVDYGYQTNADDGWSQNYGATIGLLLHN
ncbi:MAG: outer membrane beta-barrel protein [Alphaproteobacteria bacterium]|nr:outer membrane beta-barrel protein [Alphaproteobacteria bacterium]